MDMLSHPIPPAAVSPEDLRRLRVIRGLRRRLAAWVTGLVGAVSGIAPHVLHHVGPLAGAALLAGTAGTALFGGLGLLLSVPFLLRLKKRFDSWRAPAIALVIFAAAFLVSSQVIGPAIRGGDTAGTPIEQPASPAATPAGRPSDVPAGDHAEHH
ncbi:hypothetical protein [Miltoncostaea marina]|uniref:hypothetical protein n=1 Tax=Miltoncostaea marina TaxID=2843215 RepID=UPI001C3E3953|nr:hypothetical protein [Miltoncostaea marina]